MIVSLTSIPPRFGGLEARLNAILAQGPDRVCLTLPHRYVRFPDWDGTVPKLPSGVELLRGGDCGPATKFTQVFARHPSADILICDDDCTYGRGWVDAFRAARRGRHDAVIAASVFDARRLAPTLHGQIAQGFAGILLRPDMLDAAVMRPDPRSSWVDDIWLSAFVAAAGQEIVPCQAARLCVEASDAADQLQDTRILGQTRADLNRAVALELQERLGL